MGLEALPPSLDGGANLLLELAGLYQAGRPELSMTDRLRPPWCPPEVADATRDFAGFAHDQYEDAVALLAALSTKLSNASAEYTRADDEAGRAIDEILTTTRYEPGEGE